METESHKHSDYKQNIFTLWFKDKRLEHNFRAAHTKKTLLQVRTALILGAIVYTAFAILDFLMLETSTSDALVIRFAFAVPAFIVGFGLSFIDYFRKKLQLLVATLIFIAGLGVAIISIIYNETTSDIYLAGTLIPVFWAFMFSGLRLVAATITCAALIICYEIIFTQFGNYPRASIISYNFFLIAITIIGLFGGYMIEYYFRKDFIKSRLIDEKRRENEKLLLNILPLPIANRLKSQPGTIAQGYNDAGILFADLVDFSEMTRHCSPDELVAMLNNVFSRFDDITEKFQVEKIKTMGDSYMVVSGLHSETDTRQQLHALANAALEMRHQLNMYNVENGQQIEMRLGIHCGPVVAGVIGTRKFIYDVWGESVNIASRIESSSMPGRIQISQDAYEILQNDYYFEERGTVELKGNRSTHTWFLTGHKKGLSPSDENPSVMVPPKTPEQAPLTIQ